ncbi:hypothetical protein RFI_19348 [Reticulomyxa filosa]|uniref:Kelch motif family protein n=1 Tax=Reticulomyxa filosa TaxID=46433 RepID=X6MWW4_RETFI|nr:hypothetical protein RFI_19348 [Reticulomyxa filosa]|eukprot:ETO17957.1 hypothetical protein RFI_19348 [Reticulomyxa filosa]
MFLGSDRRYWGKEREMEDQFQLLPFATLPPLPSAFALPQCVSFGEEIVICGGYHNNRCYSYHIKKQQYKPVCMYPKEVKLKGHTVVSYPCKEDANTLVILSFGGDDLSCPYHTLWMHYKSVWENESEKKEGEGKTSRIRNKWYPLPNLAVLGKEQHHNLRGARGVISGSANHLLFITRPPNKIDVFDLNTFTYMEVVRNNTVRIDKQLQYHCFLLLTKTNSFVCICEDRTLLIEFHEANASFSYQQLPGCYSLRNWWNSGFIKYNHLIFLFGGQDYHRSTYQQSIFVYNVKTQTWSDCNLRMPVPIGDCFVIAVHPFSSLHVFGGRGQDSERQHTHLLLHLLVCTIQNKTKIQK